jgi:hypothetical protein
MYHIMCGELREILGAKTINLVVSAPVPSERVALGLAAMRHGKDDLSDKPGFTTLDYLAEAGVLPQGVAVGASCRRPRSHPQASARRPYASGRSRSRE